MPTTSRPAIEEILCQDPGQRGVAGFRWQARRLGEGQLAAGAESLLSAKAVAIVTGFAVSQGNRYTAETDGPPGALALAEVLLHAGADVALVSDAVACPALRAGCRTLGLPTDVVHEFPFEDADDLAPARQSNQPRFNGRSDAWVDAFLSSDLGRRLTHLIAIERVGPSHTLESLLAMPDPVVATDDFLREVPPEHRDVCHNMRGQAINAVTAKTHRLFELVAQRRLPIATLGIGDGGNEIGMGRFPWAVLREAIARGPAARVACRIATDITIVAGVSNWGGYALAAVLDQLHHGHFFHKTWNAAREQMLLRTLVDEAGCVDGVTGRSEPTVDGLTLEALSAFWQQLQAAVR